MPDLVHLCMTVTDQELAAVRDTAGKPMVQLGGMHGGGVHA